jgi:phosphatidylinositol glycan class O
LKRFDKAIVIFVDALRFDFIFTNGQHYGLPTLESKLLNEPYNAKLYKFIADPPTTTMQRIKALMSGSLPTFIDAGSNFNSYVIEDDNLIKQLHLNNKSVVILGDDTWLSLFEHEFIREHHTYPSFNIKDLDTNDQNVNEQLRQILDEQRQTSFKWNFIVAHYLGLDHCGHSFGPKSPVIKRKLRDIDDSIRFVLEKLDNDTLLVVIGDHGMTETGDHGGDSKLELETALFFYSKTKMFIPELNLNENMQLMRFESIRQINLTPNLALLLGVPIPFSNLGIVLLDIFQNKQLEAIEANYKQVIFSFVFLLSSYSLGYFTQN